MVIFDTEGKVVDLPVTVGNFVDLALAVRSGSDSDVRSSQPNTEIPAQSESAEEIEAGVGEDSGPQPVSFQTDTLSRL